MSAEREKKPQNGGLQLSKACWETAAKSEMEREGETLLFWSNAAGSELIHHHSACGWAEAAAPADRTKPGSAWFSSTVGKGYNEPGSALQWERAIMSLVQLYSGKGL